MIDDSGRSYHVLKREAQREERAKQLRLETKGPSGFGVGSILATIDALVEVGDLEAVEEGRAL